VPETKPVVVPQLAEGFSKALKVFETHAPDVMDIDMTIRGKTIHAELLHLLSLGEAYDNPNALMLMADKLPAMLVFYGLAMMEAEERQAALEEEADLFIHTNWHPELERLTLAISNMATKDKEGKLDKIPASLKSAPTKDGIRAAIIVNNLQEWDDIKARLSAARRSAKVLNNVYKGLDARIRLLGYQLTTSNSMVRRGINQ